MEIFGYTIKKKGENQVSLASPIREAFDDGAVIETQEGAGGIHTHLFDVGYRFQDENRLISSYREAAFYPDVKNAVDAIVNEALVYDDVYPVQLNLDKCDFLADSVKATIKDEFENVLKLLNFDKDGFDIFKRWYVDGRLFYYMELDKSNLADGIKRLQMISPYDIKKVIEKEVAKDENGIETVKTTNEYFVYSDRKLYAVNQGLKITGDCISFVHSGLYSGVTKVATDASNNSPESPYQSLTIVSYLHECLRLLNQLQIMENSLVIYRVSRAPERRVFYVDVGNLPKNKAEQYLSNLMGKFQNKMTYDGTTGLVKATRNQLSMQEDFWLPRRNGEKGTEITTLPGGSTLGELADVEYFQKKLFKCLNVPINRLDSESGLNFGRSSEITRDELSFYKFVKRLRTRFDKLFFDLLKVQLIAKNVITDDDWHEIQKNAMIDYYEDSYFSEIKELEMLQGRLEILQTIEPYVGKYFSEEYVKKDILKLSDDDIAKIIPEPETPETPAPGEEGFEPPPETPEEPANLEAENDFGSDELEPMPAEGEEEAIPSEEEDIV